MVSRILFFCCTIATFPLHIKKKKNVITALYLKDTRFLSSYFKWLKEKRTFKHLCTICFDIGAENVD